MPVRSLASQAPKGNIVWASADLSKMNPAMIAPTGGMVGSGAMGRGPRDRDIGTTVTVVKVLTKDTQVLSKTRKDLLLEWNCGRGIK